MSGTLTRPDWAAAIKDLGRRVGILERRTTPTIPAAATATGGGSAPYITVSTSSTPEPFKSAADYQGDGTADQVAIQAAIDQADAETYASTIWLFPGAYRTTAAITIHDSPLVGDNRAATTVTAGAGSYNLIGSSDANDVTLRRLGLVGNNNPAVVLTHDSVLTVEDCTLRPDANTAYAIHARTLKAGSKIVGSNIRGMTVDDGIFSTIIVGNRWTYTGIVAPIFDHSILAGNVINVEYFASSTAAEKYAVLLAGGDYSQISDNIIRCDYGGLSLTFFSYGTVTGNVIDHSQFLGGIADQDGIFLDDTASRNVIQTNRVRSPNPSGRYHINISASSCANNMVTNNLLQGGGVSAALNNSGTATVTAAGNAT